MRISIAIPNDLVDVSNGKFLGKTDLGEYFKGPLFLNTLRSVMNDDKRWWRLIHGFYQHFKYQSIMTEDVVAYFNRKTGRI